MRQPFDKLDWDKIESIDDWELEIAEPYLAADGVKYSLPPKLHVFLLDLFTQGKWRVKEEALEAIKAIQC